MRMLYKVFFGSLVLSNVFMSEVNAGSTREQMEKLSQGFRNTCINKLGADRTLVEGIRDGKFPENADEKVRCYPKCIATITKIFKDGKMDMVAVEKQARIMMTEDIADGMLAASDQCFKEIVNEGDDCDYVFRYLQCTYLKNPDIFFFP
uniref:Odorant-binding protein 34 n=1 Tax=Encarsia formosa TaxID=32400 RepID=A0A514TU14_ENCFO|nr:odorant-binding protein 34 [Encarsia formosa]